jgi:hypothetical protein
MADDGFVSRWARRKAQVQAGKAVEDEPVVDAPASTPSPQPEDVPPPTLEETRSLTFDSDFKRFVAPEVAPEVKNAAVKKLFADPRFNVRDMMDIYADDYSQPDPLPESMVRELATARFLKLFEEKPDDEGGQTVAQSPLTPQAPPPESPDADPDLQLQQDDAPAGESAGDGAGRGAAAPHEPLPPGSREFPEGDPV